MSQKEQSGIRTPMDESKTKAALGTFVLEFVKAISLTGIYPADHPAIRNVAVRPFRSLQDLKPVTPEFGFITAAGQSSDQTNVEGIFEEPVSFGEIVQSTMGETFARKFTSYLERNHLVSFSLKTAIPESEFERFIAALVARKTREDERGTRDDSSFSQHLIDNEIFHVNAVTRDEMLGAGRVIPWRVRIAISRLQKDLAILPLYSEASLMELQEAKAQLIDDIIRPLRRPSFVKELLINMDLLEGHVKEMTPEDVEMSVVEGLDVRMLENVAWDVVKTLEYHNWGEVVQTDGQESRRVDVVMKRILKILAIRLVEMDIDQTYELLQSLFDKKLLGFKELPVNLQRTIMTDKWTNQFLAHDKEVLKSFKTLTNKDAYTRFLENLDYVFPELILRGRLAHVAHIVNTLLMHHKEPTLMWRQKLATQQMKKLGNPEVMASLRVHAEVPERKTRQFAMDAISRFGDPGLELLVQLLFESPDSMVRRDALIVLEKMGGRTHEALLAVMGEKGKDWYIYRNCIELLGKTDAKRAIPEIERFLKHWNGKVREAAAIALYSLVGPIVWRDLIDLLNDNEWRVQRRILVIMGDAKCNDQRFLNHLASIVTAAGAEENAPAEPLVLVALDVISGIGDFKTGKDELVSDLLLDLLFAGRAKLLKRIFKKNRVTVRDSVKRAMCQTLGRIGSKDVEVELRALSEEASADIAEACLKAANEIRTRRSKS